MFNHLEPSQTLDDAFIEALHNKFEFKNKFYLQEQLSNIPNFFARVHRDINSIPTQSEIKTSLRKLVKHSNKLRTILKQASPKVKKTLNQAYKDKFSKIPLGYHPSPTNILDYNLRMLAESAHYIRNQISSKTCNALRSAVLLMQLSIGRFKISINFRINDSINMSSFSTKDELCNLLDNQLEQYISACLIELKKISRGGGPKHHSLTENLIILLASIYEKGTKKKAITYFDKYSKSAIKYKGEFYSFIIACRPIFIIYNLPLPKKESSVAQLATEVLSLWRPKIKNKIAKKKPCAIESSPWGIIKPIGLVVSEACLYQGR